MHVKKYTAINMQEALKLVKQALGPDAVIISTRNIEPVSGYKKGHTVEVTAAIDSSYDDSVLMSSPGEKRISNNVDSIKEIITPLQNEITELKNTIKLISPRLISSFNENPDDSIQKEAVELKSIFYRLLNNNGALRNIGIHDSLINSYNEAIDRGINERLAFILIEKVNRQVANIATTSEDNLRNRLFNEMMKCIKTSGPLKTNMKKTRAIAFVGTTGVGKTTTVAKLAAEFSLNQKQNVALISFDTYRIAAIEQLKIYAKIIDIPLFVVRDNQEFYEAMHLCKDKDIVLIDTAGRSRKDQKQIKELAGYLKGDIPVEIHLILSSIEQEDILLSNIKHFDTLSVDHLIFSKLDEVNLFGKLFNIAMKASKPISYLTTGQKVPEDIETATPEKLIDMIFK